MLTVDFVVASACHARGEHCKDAAGHVFIMASESNQNSLFCFLHTGVGTRIVYIAAVHSTSWNQPYPHLQKSVSKSLQ